MQKGINGESQEGSKGLKNVFNCFVVENWENVLTRQSMIVEKYSSNMDSSISPSFWYFVSFKIKFKMLLYNNGHKFQNQAKYSLRDWSSVFDLVVFFVYVANIEFLCDLV